MKISSRVKGLGGEGGGVRRGFRGEEGVLVWIGVDEGGGRRRKRAPERRESPDKRFQRWRSAMERLFSRAILAKLSPFLIRTHSVGGVVLVWAMGEGEVLAGVEGVGAEVGVGVGEEGRRRTSPGWRR